MKLTVDEAGLVKYRAKEIRRERCLELQEYLSARFKELRERDIPTELMRVELDQGEIDLLREFNVIDETERVKVHGEFNVSNEIEKVKVRYGEALALLPYRKKD